MRRFIFALIFLFAAGTGSLPAMAADGNGHEMIRSHFANQQPIVPAVAGSVFENTDSHYARQQRLLPAAEHSEHKTTASHHAAQERNVLATGSSELEKISRQQAPKQSVVPVTAGSETEQKLKTLAAKKVKAECQSCKVTVECKWMSPSVSKANPEIISGLYFDKPGMPAGYATAKVAFDSAPPSANATVQFYVSVRQKLPVAAANIESGVAVSAADFIWQWKDVSRLNRKPVASEDYFKDKTASRMIREGHIFYTSDLLGATSIRPGDRVTMQYGEQGVQLQIACIAREAKGVGQRVRLYSKETGRRYLAKIVSNNEIIWIRTL
jgi:flagella basal body P-ring formation protein FlgA